MKDSERPPRYRATVDVDWPGKDGKQVLAAGKTSDKVPPKVAAWMLACGALEEVNDR